MNTRCATTLLGYVTLPQELDDLERFARFRFRYSQVYEFKVYAV
jgi:hypothetical protein